MPHLKELYEARKEQGLVIIGVHSTQGGGDMEAFVREQGIKYPVALDVEGRTVKAFAADSYPDYYLIDRSGKLRVADLANAGLDDAVTRLLAEKAEPAKPDARKLYAEALSAAEKSDRKVLFHVHGPG